MAFLTFPPLHHAHITATSPQDRLVCLPRSPKTASPVPWLTSIHSTVRRGPYGNATYRGNCSGYLIKDLLRFFHSSSVLDPMTGAARCRDVCAELDIPCYSGDIKAGFDAGDASCFQDIGRFDFVWLHPPYWKMIRYSDDPRCLSNAETIDDFTEMLRNVLRNCMSVLTPGGKIAILMGNYSDHGRFQPVTHFTMQAALDVGLWPACTDIVRFQHGNTSSRKTYNSSFIPGLHDVFMVFQPDPSR